jgi:ATP-binding cassette subfamily F protein 3
MDATVLDEILRVAPRMEEGRARNLLGSFLFSGDDVFKQVKDLSGGERNRVALAQLTLAAGNLLVMDEPTNHLDIDAREALESVLSSNASTLLFVSHDRYFIDAVAEKLWIVQDGTLVEYNGTYSEYQDYRARQLEHESQQADSSSRARENKQRQSDGQRDASEKERKKRIARLEADVERLEQELAQVKAALEQASNAQDVQQVTALGMQYAELEQQLHTRYEEWAELAD